MSNLLSAKVESFKFSERFQQNTTKMEELESNIVSLKGEIKSFQEKSVAVVYNYSESNVNSKMLIYL